MLKHVKSIRCTHVVAQVGLGYYDAEGNMIGEQVFPQCEGRLTVARLYHPHPEQLASLIEACIEQAWATLSAGAAGAEEPALEPGIGASSQRAGDPPAEE